MTRGSPVNMSSTVSFFRALWEGCQQPPVVKRYRDTGIAIVFTGFTQLLLIPSQIALDRASVKIPASILFMLLCAGSMIIANAISKRVGFVYNTHIRGATDFLGRHMSFGFVASFLMLNRDHITDPMDIPKIAGSFLVTGLFGYAGTFAIASLTCHVEKRIRRNQGSTPYGTDDVENNATKGRWTKQQLAKRISKTSQTSSISIPSSLPLPNQQNISTNNASHNSPTYCGPQAITAWKPWVEFILRTSPSWICGSLLLFLGLPLTVGTGFAIAFEATGFILLWVISVQLQRSLKASSSQERGRYPTKYTRMLSVAVIVANPVLVTALLGSAYFWIKKVCTGDDISDILTAFRRWSNLARAFEVTDLDDGHIVAQERTLPVGAGDILAGPILDAGIASLGFKMFEHRKALVAALATMLVTTSTMAVAGTFFNVAVSRHAFGLAQEEALAFSCRSVTIAFGVHVVEGLGGTGTLASALCIFNGMVFQMSGNWMLRTLKVQDIPDTAQKSDELYRGQDIQRSMTAHEGSILLADHPQTRNKDPSNSEVSTAPGFHDPFPTTDNITASDRHIHTSSSLFPFSTSENHSDPQTPTTIGTSEIPTRANSSHHESNIRLLSPPQNPIQKPHPPLPSYSSPRLVATGVTIGINAAAMGTAHLIERDSAAAAYSALSMTMFGAATVVLTTVIPGVGDILQRLAST